MDFLKLGVDSIGASEAFGRDEKCLFSGKGLALQIGDGLS